MFLSDIFHIDHPSQRDYFKTIAKACSEMGWDRASLASDSFILFVGFAANAPLFSLFYGERRTLSASQILGVNLVLMDVLYLIILAFCLIFQNTTNLTVYSNNSVTSDMENSMERMKDITSMLNMIGCPLLLACMCVERYVAVIKPVLYLRVRRWEYRVAVSAVVWLFTLFFCLGTGLLNDMVLTMVPVTIIICILFVLMLASLVAMIWSLRSQSPALIKGGNQGQNSSPMRRRAVGNVMAVVIPAVMSYLPVLVMLPLVLYKFYWNNGMDNETCTVFELSKLFPKFGLLIGPFFYLSKAKQFCCLSKKTEVK